MKYAYHAYTKDRKIKKGSIEADSHQMAEEVLLKNGFERVLNLHEVGLKNQLMKTVGSRLSSVTNADVLEFSRELANLLNSGISIITSLELLEKETANKAMKAIVTDILSELRAGKSLSRAMSRHPKAFSGTYLAVIRTGEQTGELDNSLRYMTEHIEKQENINKRVRRALTYPILVIIVAIGVSTLLITAVLPPIIGMFSSLGTELPLITRIFVAIANFVVDYKYYLLALVICLPVALFAYIYLHPRGRYNVDRAIMAIPQVGQVVLKTNLLFFCRATAVLLHASVSITNVLAICSSTVGNSWVRAAIKQGEIDLLKGYPFSRAMENTGLFSPSSIEAIVVGERTGELESAMERLAENFERTSHEKMDSLISMIEPTMTIGIGLIVGLLAISIIAPIYSMSGGLP